MKVLITGATGLIGPELIALLISENIAVHYLTTSKSKIAEKPNYKGFYWNPAQGVVDENAFDGVDTIVHLAGAPIVNRWTDKNKKEIIDSRVNSAHLLFDTLSKIPHQVKQFVSASAIGFYPGDPDKVFSENDSEIASNFLGGVVSKWEAAANKFQSLNLKVCKIRTGLVLAKKAGFLFEMAKPIRWWVGAPMGSGNQWQSWVHIDDLVHMYFSAIKNGWEGTYNATAPNPVTNKDLIKAIAKKMKKPLFMPNVPEWFMNILLGEMHIMLFISQKVSSKKAVEKGFRFKYEFLEQALGDLVP